MSRCLVLGANGFIGSHVVDKLIENGETVRAFDRFGGKVLFNEHPSIDLMAGDFMNQGDLDKALEGVEYVFHFISTTTPASAENDPLIDIETNIKMSVELFQACVRHKVKRVIFASTGGAIYGAGERPRIEEDLPLPISPYAVGKLTIEHYLRYFRVKHGLDSVALRISNPYGERQPLNRKQGVIPIFVENTLNSKPITILGDGSMVRDYIYVKDVASIVTQIFNRPINYDTYNVGSGRGTTINELVRAIEEVTGIKPKIEKQPVPSTYINKVILDTQRLTNELGGLKMTPFGEGLKATSEYIKENMVVPGV